MKKQTKDHYYSVLRTLPKIHHYVQRYNTDNSPIDEFLNNPAVLRLALIQLDSLKTSLYIAKRNNDPLKNLISHEVCGDMTLVLQFKN